MARKSRRVHGPTESPGEPRHAEQQPPPANRRAAWLVAAALAVVAFVAYVPTLSNGFVSWDDDQYVTDNRFIRDGLSADAAAWAFRSTYAGNWHPLTWLSHAADVSLYGLDRPWGHHMTSVLLHAANTALLMIVLWRLTRRLWPSAVVAALFALHPLHVETVSWVAQRKELLCTLLALLALWAYAAYAARPSLWRYLLVAAAFAGALMAKPMAVTLPLVMLVLDAWPLGRLSWRSVAEKVPLLAITAASCVVTFVAQRAGGAVRELESLDLGSRIVHAVYAYGMYPAKAVWPGAMVPLYPLPDRGGDAIEPWMVALAGATLAGLTAWAFVLRRRRPYLLAGWLIYLGTLVPVIGLVQVGQQALADRYTYVPLIGVFIAVVWLAAEAAGARPRLQPAALALAALALALFGSLTWRQQHTWRDSLTLWTTVREAYPRNVVPHNNLAKVYTLRGDLKRAVASYREAAAIKPASCVIRANLGLALVLDRRIDEALPELNHALELNPDCGPAHFALGRAMLGLDKFEEAEKSFRRSVECEPESWRNWANLGTTQLQQNKGREAAVSLRRALELNPNEIQVRANLAAALLIDNRPAETEQELRTLLQASPDMAFAHHLMALALDAQGRTEQAKWHAAEAARLRQLAKQQLQP